LHYGVMQQLKQFSCSNLAIYIFELCLCFWNMKQFCKIKIWPIFICSTYSFIFVWITHSASNFGQWKCISKNNHLLCSKATPQKYANTIKSGKASVFKKCRLLGKCSYKYAVVTIKFVWNYPYYPSHQIKTTINACNEK